MINEIVNLEWEMFQNVENTGGRANCQDDYETFYIMRASQYKCFAHEVLVSYLNDLKEAKAHSRNLILEKYARMMAYTHLEEYEQIKDYFEPLDDQALEIIEQIVEIQLNWRKEFKRHFPKLIQLSRQSYSTHDSHEHTSFETYLRGELMTYSKQTLILYTQMIVDYYKCNINLVTSIMHETIKFYGYESLEEAEAKL